MPRTVLSPPGWAVKGSMMILDNAWPRKLAFFAFFVILLILVAKMLYPFMTILLWSGIFYVVLEPLYRKAVTRKDGKPRSDRVRIVMAGAMAVFVVILIALPLSLLAFALIGQVKDFSSSAIEGYDKLRGLFADQGGGSPIAKLVSELTGGVVSLGEIDLGAQINGIVQRSSDSLVSFSTSIVKNVFSLVMSLALIIFTLYFFFLDGKKLMEIFIKAFPIERERTVTFILKLRDTASHLVRGYFLVAVYQGIAAFVIFSLFGVKGPLLLAILISFASFIPIVGTGLVWLPVSVVRAATGDIVGGVLILALCAFFIATVDNFLRPFFLHEKIKIHPLLIFFAIIGGLAVFGFNGLVLGPLVLMLFFTAAEYFDLDAPRRNEDPDMDKPEPGAVEGTRKTEQEPRSLSER